MVLLIYLLIMTVSGDQKCNMLWRQILKTKVLDPKDILMGKFDIYWSRLVFIPDCVEKIVIKMNNEKEMSKDSTYNNIGTQNKITVEDIGTECDSVNITIQLTDKNNLTNTFIQTVDPLTEFFNKEEGTHFPTTNSSVYISREDGRFWNQEFKRLCFESVDFEINGISKEIVKKGQDPHVQLEIMPCQNNIKLLQYHFLGKQNITIKFTAEDTGCPNEDDIVNLRKKGNSTINKPSNTPTSIAGSVGGTAAVLIMIVIAFFGIRRIRKKLTSPVNWRTDLNDIYGTYGRGWDREGDYGDGDVSEVVDTNAEYGHGDSE